ncbi:predicted protein [Naegleria gruberi]|uniref:Predicted protein n=1 Tax=Naegleria gruberi TaxID=5762 RepID=D2W2L2_NAEGR|nr:uncharacterized protein NAEGRDRAFT_75629 [Naegleria gruberi]EFC36635.1 predicted protein [Naegleria gruberi]|eukprot:XP_002669379.1 predicted protein [Naegleria gruberi strain NEG-M]
MTQFPMENVFPSFYCECYPHTKGKDHYNIAIALIFRQCFYSNSDVASYVIGWLSILTSMISLFPQIIKNFTLKSSAGLSIYVFVIWMIGDITNLVGCILTNQLATQIYLAAYYVAMDVIIISQYIWYEFKFEQFKKLLERVRNWKKSNESSKHATSSLQTSTSGSTSTEMTTTQKTILPSHYLPNLLTLIIVILMIVMAELTQGEEEIMMMVQSCVSSTEQPQYLYILGIVCSYISCICYVAALAPQVYKNYKRKGVKGLSVS